MPYSKKVGPIMKDTSTFFYRDRPFQSFISLVRPHQEKKSCHLALFTLLPFLIAKVARARRITFTCSSLKIINLHITFFFFPPTIIKSLRIIERRIYYFGALLNI